MFTRALLPVTCLVASGAASAAAPPGRPDGTPPSPAYSAEADPAAKAGRLGRATPSAASAEEGGPTPELPVAGVVRAARLNVRLRPDVSAPALGQVKGGTGLVVRRLADGWCEIDYPPSLGVWIHRKLVRLEGDPPRGGDPSAEGDPALASPEAPARGVVTRSGARLRATPSLDRKVILAERERGTAVRVTGSAGEWLRIVPPSDLRAYVHADYVELRAEAAAAATAAFREALDKIALAEKLLAGAEAPREDSSEVEAEGGPAQEDGDAREDEGAREDAAAPVRASSWRPEHEGRRAPGLGETRRALELLDEALASEGLARGEMARLRARVRALVGRLAPSRWLRLFEEARESHRRNVDRIERRYSGRLREAKVALDSARLEHTARGVVARPAPGSDRWRLMVGETLVSELDSRGADLSAFAGRPVGVVGVRHSAEGTGGLPWIEVRYVEELESAAAPGPDAAPGRDAAPGAGADKDVVEDGGVPEAAPRD